VAARQHLGDHPAHRGPDHVCALDVEVVEQPLGVLGEVDERVRHRAGAAKHIAQHPRIDRALGALAVQLRRKADVAMIESDDPKPLIDQLLAEAVGPHRELGAHAHYQQHRRRCGITEVLVVEVDVTAARRAASGQHVSKLRRPTRWQVSSA
jgi:hypothetical protein